MSMADTNPASNQIPSPTEETDRSLTESCTYFDPASSRQSQHEKDRENLAAVIRLLPDFSPPGPSPVAQQFERVQEALAPEIEKPSVTEQPDKTQPTRSAAPPRSRLRKWLIITTGLVAATVIVWHFVRFEAINKAVNSQDVIILDNAQMPEGSFLTKARKVRNTLVGVVA
ncbi:MAG TPA: hypothetical protein VEF04_10975, partial [Blastocatellia bacterium]|nr:hypothetical protein [Blastocatellia bacterium]